MICLIIVLTIICLFLWKIDSKSTTFVTKNFIVYIEDNMIIERLIDKERIELFKDRTIKNRYRYDRAPSWYIPVIKSFIFDYTNADISPSIDLDIIVNKSNDIIVRVL